MNEQERSELARLKERQAQLEQELASLGRQLRAFETRFIAARPAESKPESIAPLKLKLSPPEPKPVPTREIVSPERVKQTSGPPPIPPVIPPPSREVVAQVATAPHPPLT